MFIRKFSLLLFFVSTLAFAQNQGGLIPIDPQFYQALPKSVYSLRNTGRALPARVDLSATLVPLSQGPVGACASWTVVYELTRLERTRNRWSISNNNMFSASYLYNQINNGRDRGSSFFNNLNLTVEKGCSTYQTFPYTFDYLLQPDARAHEEAARYKTLEWKTIDQTVESFKSWLGGSYGIVCGFEMWDSFDSYTTGNYRPAGQKGVLRDGERFPYHGCLVIGYDDSLRRFKAINSWGEYWGEKGYFYFDYGDIKNLISESYVIIPKSRLNPPVNIEASRGIYNDRIVISWKKSNEVAEYLVFRLEDDRYLLLGKSSTDRFTDTTAERGKKHFYYVVAGAGNTMSEYSSPVEGWIKSETKPGIPQSVTLLQLDSGILISFYAVEDAEYYDIYRWNERTAAFVWIGKAERNLFQDREPLGENDKFAAYVVVAVNRYGSSLPSALSHIVPDNRFRGRTENNNWDRRYDGLFYQFDTNRFFSIERRVQQYHEQMQRRMESYISVLEQYMKNILGR